MRNVIICGSGHFLPPNVVKNNHFLNHSFFDENGVKIDKPNSEIISKFEEITEIAERRYADEDMSNSQMATIAAKQAIEDANIDKNDLDYVMIAHNYGDIDAVSQNVDIMPSIAARVKNQLGIKNNKCRPYDMAFGCPGWVEASILSSQLLKSGVADTSLVVGSETLSRAVDPHDRNAMIFADGSGAAVLKVVESDDEAGIIHAVTISDNMDELVFLSNGPSLNTDYDQAALNIKMKGRKVYEYALRKVPAAIKVLLDEAGRDITDISTILLHQANAKMDHAIIKRLYRLYNIKDVPKGVDPMTIQWLGNSSVATIPTMFDMIVKGEMEGYSFKPGDEIVMASVGGGMNINAILYKFPDK